MKLFIEHGLELVVISKWGSGHDATKNKPYIQYTSFYEELESMYILEKTNIMLHKYILYFLFRGITVTMMLLELILMM